MIVVGGFYSLIHIFIIAIKETIYVFNMNKFASYLVIRAVVMLVIFSVFSLTSGAMEYKTNFTFLAGAFDRCEPIFREEKANKVVLRIDDIQAFTWNNVQRRLLTDAWEHNIVPVAGVIPYYLRDDREIYDLLKKNSCNLEIAQHGWTHGVEPGGFMPEFGDIGEDEANERINNGKEILEKLYGKNLTTFIPPHNIYSNEAAKAIKRAGFKVISAEGEGGYHYTAATYNSAKEELVPVDDIISICEQSFLQNNSCIIVAHPQDYATDGALDNEKYAHYLELLDRLKSMNVEFVKFEDLVGMGEAGNMPELSDYDNDGLSYRQEKTNGTDPVNPDTDDDGHLDGVEVMSNFDPKGAGRLRI